MIPEPSLVAFHASTKAKWVCDASPLHQFDSFDGIPPMRCPVPVFSRADLDEPVDMAALQEAASRTEPCGARLGRVTLDVRALYDECVVQTRVAKKLRGAA